jgi:hypothetical protein
VKTRIGDAIELGSPFLATGFDDAADEARRAVAHGLRAQSLAYLGRRPIADDVPWLQVAVAGEDEPDPAAEAVVIAFRDGFRPVAVERAREGQLLGLAAAGAELSVAIPFALERGLDVLVLEGSPRLASSWPELAGPPDLTAVRDTIRVLRELNREEDIALLWFGGVRTGTDAAKLIGLGANAAVIGVSLALAVGGQIENGGLAFYGDIAQEERDEKAELFLKALSTEASIMPRCTGKTDIHNIEPEDLRSISIATAKAAGIPLAGLNPRLVAGAEA